MMATEELGDDEALDRLRELALASGASMRAVAEWVVDERPTGPMPVELDDAALHSEN